jgi:hypothetical protein
MFLLVMGFVLAIAAGPALAGPEETGKETAADKVQMATERLMTTLSGLPDAVPAEARAAIDKAIAASAKGHEAALSALARVRPEPDAADAATADGEGGKPDVTGLEKARQAVEAAFETSIDTLTEVSGKVPAEVEGRILEALAKVESNRTAALDNLTLLIAGEHPGRAASERPETPERPDRPDRPDRPELPDRPDLPEKPDIPDRPEIPERPEIPDKPDRP